jgi:diguanylate cyclase (GGDEF)-like protein/PAS domain S-box-containing protein
VASDPTLRPFGARGRRTVTAILITIALSSTVGVGMSILATSHSENRATVIEVAARQRTLAERYANEVLLALDGQRVDPGAIGSDLRGSADALLEGGTAPPVNGDDDETELSPATDPIERAQLAQARRLVEDLTNTGSAILAHQSVTAVPLTANEHLTMTDPVMRLRVLVALTSNASLNAARTIAEDTDRGISHLIILQVLLGIGGLLISLLLAWALIAATRRQTAHFRSLVTNSTDLVFVLDGSGCRYVSSSVIEMLGRSQEDLLMHGFERYVHPDDRVAVQAAQASGEPHEMTFRMVNRFGEWRHLEAHVSDLRTDRHIRGVVLNARDVTERVRLEHELTEQAFHDSLTGLANRALFRDRLDQALARSARSNEVLSVVLVDLDSFKQVNDSLGHDAGDGLLQEVARRFFDISRKSDTVARLGGDEFALLLEGANEVAAAGVARRLLDSLAEPITIAGRDLVLSASVGIVVHPGGAGSGDDLVRHADVAMYAAKEAGRGRYEVFHYDMARELGELLGMEHDIRLGLSRGEFSLHYQPEVDLANGEIIGVEGLLRWTSPSRGTVSPMQFIPVAEATGAILAIGEFVIREACRQTAEWLGADLVPDRFVTWVNVSGRQLSAGGLKELVTKTLDEYGLPATSLGLEVTETAIVVEGPAGLRARTELEELHRLGVKIAIDDFGTGFSSLNQLRSFPVDVLKVDRSFIQGIEHDAKDAAITANLASLAHALGLVAIAEGIESDAQWASARTLGCDQAQGYHFARPAPADEIERVLATRSHLPDDRAASVPAEV